MTKIDLATSMEIVNIDNAGHTFGGDPVEDNINESIQQYESGHHNLDGDHHQESAGDANVNESKYNNDKTAIEVLMMNVERGNPYIEQLLSVQTEFNDIKETNIELENSNNIYQEMLIDKEAKIRELQDKLLN